MKTNSRHIFALLSAFSLVQTTFGQPAYTLDQDFKPILTRPGGTISSLAIADDGKVYVAGQWDAIDGIPRDDMARLNLTGGLDVSYSAELPGGGNSYIQFLAFQSSGKLVVVGEFLAEATKILRLNPDGTRDHGFQSGRPFEYFAAIALLSDDKMIVGGVSYDPILKRQVGSIARLNADGSVDRTFSLATLDSNGTDLAIQADGKIVASGCFTAVNGVPHLGLARLNADGSLDSTFRHNLQSTFPPELCFTSVAPLPDGKLMVGGFSIGGIARLNADGTLDPGFDARPANIGQVIRKILVQSDGKLVAVVDPDHGLLVRLNADGSRDPTFNASADHGNRPMAFLQRDGRLLVADGGRLPVTLNEVVRLNTDGSVDSSFASPSADIPGIVGGTIQQSDGKLVIAGGFSHVNGISRRGFARLNEDGSLDLSFNPSPDVPSVCAGRPLSCVNLIRQQQSDGKLIVGGRYLSMDTNGLPLPSLVRLNLDGSRDPGFATSVTDPVIDLELQTDGKIFCAVASREDWQTGANRVVRLHADGSVDASFNWREPLNYIAAIATAPDDKLLVGGPFANVNDSPRLGLARFNADGSLDTAFVPALPASDVGVTDIAVLPDGKLLVTTSYWLFRLNSNGTFDTSFGSGVWPWGREISGVKRLTLMAGNRILLEGGRIQQIDGECIFSNNCDDEGTDLALLSANGQLDRFFGRWHFPGGLCYFQINDVLPQSDGALVVSGCFQEVNSQPRFSLARLRPAPAIRSTGLNRDGRFSCTIGGESGWTYRIDSSPDLAQWIEVATLPSAGFLTEFVAPDPANTSKRFYRAVRLSP